ncbi:MAG: phage tail sheath family protein [Gammaproteobacteria bacterium]|nr:phage tail sheath family protein [Gammaproteobacteria bacterium]
MATYLSPGVYVHEVPSGIAPIVGVGTSTAGFIGIFADTLQIPMENPDYDPSKKSTATETETEAADPADSTAGAVRRRTARAAIPANSPFITKDFKPVDAGEIKLVTNKSECKRLLGDFSNDDGQCKLLHAVNGFFDNGGTRCYVVRVKDKSKLMSVALERFESIDEIAIVAAPGITDSDVRSAIISHCEKMGDRFAILDCAEESESDGMFDRTKLGEPTDTNYGAVYTPWFSVFDPALKITVPEGTGKRFIPPSGHIAGIYARVDAERGVHKAPANEVIRGVASPADLKYRLSKGQQDGLNPVGINCIRYMNGNVRVWGARTLGGDRNGEWKYISVRRLFLYLRESIDKGTQWVVFEPNTPNLWAKIILNVSAYLTNVWRDGALFGNTPQEAFYVKCDAETNPAEIRDLGQVVTEIGVAIARPAEFVVFKISQWQAGAGGE